jgi:hypothetical protein
LSEVTLYCAVGGWVGLEHPRKFHYHVWCLEEVAGAQG